MIRISILPSSRERLRQFGEKNTTYAQIIERVMDPLDRDRFVAEMRRLAHEGSFSPLEDF